MELFLIQQLALVILSVVVYVGIGLQLVASAESFSKKQMSESLAWELAFAWPIPVALCILGIFFIVAVIAMFIAFILGVIYLVIGFLVGLITLFLSLSTGIIVLILAVALFLLMLAAILIWLLFICCAPFQFASLLAGPFKKKSAKFPERLTEA